MSSVFFDPLKENFDSVPQRSFAIFSLCLRITTAVPASIIKATRGITAGSCPNRKSKTITATDPDAQKHIVARDIYHFVKRKTAITARATRPAFQSQKKIVVAHTRKPLPPRNLYQQGNTCPIRQKKPMTLSRSRRQQ